VPDVTQGLIEEFCERGVSMVMFDFHGLPYERCRKMVRDIRQGVFSYSLHKNHRVPYSLALVLDVVGTRMVTGTVSNTQVRHVGRNARHFQTRFPIDSPASI